MISKQGLVVVVLIPVERLDFQATSLRVPTNNSGNGLVHLVWRACCVDSQELDFLTHIIPTLHAGELKQRTGVWILNPCCHPASFQCQSICDLTSIGVWGTVGLQPNVINVGAILDEEVGRCSAGWRQLTLNCLPDSDNYSLDYGWYTPSAFSPMCSVAP